MVMQVAAVERGGREPQVIGPYRVLGHLGEGGMGVVYRAEHVESGARVALKTVHTTNERMLVSIRREIHALSRLRHPGVVRIVGEGVERSLPWYAMELLEGLNLKNFAHSRWRAALASAATMADDEVSRAVSGVELSAPPGSGVLNTRIAPEALLGQPAAAGHLAEALTLVRRLCAPLAFLHGEGIVHRDLKPENVFIRQGDVPVLVDFGLVATFEGHAGRDSLELAGATMGTPAYMAPEQIRGEVVDARADLYSLGCLLYELVTGRVPFVGTSTMELVGMHLLATPKPPSDLVEGVPPALDELILRLLSKSPRDRIGHADDVAAALASLGASADAGYDTPAPTPRAYLYRSGFTGREELFRRLRQHIDQARGGNGALVFLAGESGVGKTRLATEAGRVATGAGLRVLAGECVLFNGVELAGADYNGSPLHPFSRLLEAVVDRCLEFGPPETARVLGARGWVLAPYEPSLLRAPGLGDFPKPAELSAEAARQRLFDDLAETLAAFASERPLFLLLDDLQWADELTLAFLESLPARFFEEHAVVILGTWRSEEAGDAIRRLQALPHATTHEVARMEPSSVGEIAAAMLAMKRVPDGFERFLAERSEGNPFFVAEYLRTALAEGLLFRDEAGLWRVRVEGDVTDVLERLPLPGSVRDLVTRRLDKLPARVRALVDIASVIGREVSGELLADLGRAGHESDDDAWFDDIRTLLERQILEEPAAGNFRFVHDKLREIAYGQLGDDARRALHRRTAAAIEARCEVAGDHTPHLRALAHHWTQAAVLPKAIEYLDRAGTQALENFANREAVAFFSEVIALFERSGERADALRMARWERSLAEAHLRLGELDRCRDHAERALRHARTPLPSLTLAWVLGLVLRSLVRVWRGIAPAVPGDGRREGDTLRVEAAYSLYRMLEVFLYFDDPMRAVYAGLRSIEVAETLPPSPPLARGYAMMSIVLTASPIRQVGRRWATRSLDIAAQLDSPETLAYCLSRAGVSAIQEARWADAKAALRRGVEVCENSGDGRQMAECRFVLAACLFYCGEYDESLALATSTTRISIDRHDEQTACWGRLEQAQALVRMGRARDAIAAIDEVLAWVDAKAASFETIWCYGILAHARWQSGELDGARTAALKALAQMQRKQPVVYGSMPAVAGVALVLNDLAAKATGAARTELLAQAREASRVMRLFGLMFVFARPAQVLHEGGLARAAGDVARARSLWRRGLTLATGLGVPFEEAQLCVALAREDVGEARVALLTRAEELFARLGATWELERVRALRSEKA